MKREFPLKFLGKFTGFEGRGEIWGTAKLLQSNKIMQKAALKSLLKAFKTVRLIIVLTTCIPFFVLKAQAADACIQLFQSTSVVEIKSGMGSGVRLSQIEISKLSRHRLFWLQKVYNWSMPWDTPDISGDSRWGYNLLKQNAKYFGFERKVEDGEEQYSVPSPEHAHWAIENFNSDLFKKGRVNDLIPLNIETGQGIKSQFEFLRDFAKGVIPLAIDIPRTFIHDMNYHYVAAVLLKPQITKSWQRRADLVLKIHERARIIYRDDIIVSEQLHWLLDLMSARVDQTANAIPLMEMAQLKQAQSAPFAAALRKNLVSPSDKVFLDDLFEQVAIRAPSVFSYTYSGKITKERERALRSESGDVNAYIRSALKKLAEDFTSSMLTDDQQVGIMIDSLDRFIENPHPEILNSWLRDSQ